MKPGILYLCHRLPYPPNKGDKIRSFHILKKLAKNHDVYLGTLIDDPLDWPHLKQLKPYVKDMFVVERRSVKRHWMALVKGLLKGESLSNVLYRSPEMAFWVEQLVRNQIIHKAYIFSSTMAQYVLRYEKELEWITDFVDVDSHKWSQYAQNMSFPMSVLYQIESKRLQQFERYVAQRSQANVFVSDLEADLFRQTVMRHANPVLSIQNGVDTQYFNPHVHYTNPFQGDKKKIIFTGLMDYWPNVDAVKWFAHEVFSPLLKTQPDLEFYIVGANPNKAVFALKDKGIHVTGRVPDIRPYLKHADIVVAPLRIARGIQNKVLEAMSMNKPIIASFEAMEGIPIPPKCPIWKESTARGWQERILQLCQPESTSRVETHPWVEANFSWDAHLSQIDTLLKPIRAG